MGVTMLDSFNDGGVFHSVEEAEYANRCDEFFKEWVPSNRSLINGFKQVCETIRFKYGREEYGGQAVAEIVRFHMLAFEVGSEYKMNNNSIALLSRFIMAKYPQYDGFFRLRKINGIPEDRAKHIFRAAMFRAGQLPAAQAELF